MSKIIVDYQKIEANIKIINDFLKKSDKVWSLVVKVIGSNYEILSKLLANINVSNLHSIGVSQPQMLSAIKKINPRIETIYIKPTSLEDASLVAKHADYSLNSSIEAICALNKVAKELNIIHKVIIMVEMGDLREGIKREALIAFYEELFKLENIEIVGLGTNLGCLFETIPTYDKLLQLVLYQQIIEERFKVSLKYISGASSITLPLLDHNELPVGINHFRIGEAVFLGKAPYYSKKILSLKTNTLLFEANILELYRKDNHPDIYQNMDKEFRTSKKDSYKVVLDFGYLDVDPRDLRPLDPKIKFIGNSSDLSVYDLGENDNNHKVGGKLQFDLSYSGAAKLFNSPFVEKAFKDNVNLKKEIHARDE